MRQKQIVVAVALFALVSTGCAKRIGAGYTGIKVSYAGTARGVEDVPTVTGWVFYAPMFSKVVEYPVFIQTAKWEKQDNEEGAGDEAIYCNSRENMVIGLDVSLSFQLAAAKVPHFYLKFLKDDLADFTHGFLRNIARDAFNETEGCPKYSVDEMMGGKKSLLLGHVKDAVNTQVEPYGVRIEQFGFLGALHIPPEISASINAKIKANVDADRVEIEKRSTTAEAQKRIASAEGDAQAAVARATGEANANAALRASISPELIAWRQMDIHQQAVGRWNGILPTMTGAGAIPFINVPAGK